LDRLLRKRLGTIQKGTKIIGDGNLDYRIDLRSKDEFEDFSNEFNKMSDKLKKSFVSIESLEREITKRKQVEMALQESEGLYRTLIETSPDAIVLVDINTNFIMVNQMAVRLYGYQNAEEMIGKTFLNLIVPEERPRLFEHFKDTRQTGSNQILEHTSLKKDGSSFYAAVNASLIFDAQGRPKGIIAIIRDITEHKRAEEEREKLIHELKDALGKIQTLSGLLPICSWCKKIRDDEGYWNQIETYIGDHSEAEFTHSICPECMKKHYPDFADNKNKEVIKENIK
jgi:PAS domain S-box-containing protein